MRYMLSSLMAVLVLMAAPTGVVAQTRAPQSAGKVDKIELTDSDYILGKADAPVTMVEYASLTCPHCAAFHGETVPKLKSDYIDTGKVRLIYRDFPLDRLALTASVVARCGGKERYFGLVATLFQSQSSWARAEDPIKALERIGRLAGLAPAAIDSCIKDKKLADSALGQRLEGERTLGVSSTPTVFINGQKYVGGLTFDQIKLVIDPLLAKP